MQSPNGSSRPLIDKSIVELTKFFEDNKASAEQMSILEFELQHRTRRAAKKLHNEVKAERDVAKTSGESPRRASTPSMPIPPPRDGSEDEILQILQDAKRLAQEYRRLTGKPLGITGEVAEYEAARVLGVKLTPARQAGYDAVEMIEGTVRKMQIKGRCILDDSKSSQKLGSIRLDKEWDAVLMVLLDKNFDAVAIYQAERAAVETALGAPGSKARNERGAMAVSKFKSIGTLRWSSKHQGGLSMPDSGPQHAPQSWNEDVLLDIGFTRQGNSALFKKGTHTYILSPVISEGQHGRYWFDIRQANLDKIGTSTEAWVLLRIVPDWFDFVPLDRIRVIINDKTQDIRANSGLVWGFYCELDERNRHITIVSKIDRTSSIPTDLLDRTEVEQILADTFGI